MNKLSRLTALLLAVMLLLGSIASAEGLPIGGLSGLTSDDWDQLVDAAEANLFYTDEGDTGSEVTPESPEQPQLPASYPYTDVDEITLVQSQASAEAFMTASGAVKITHEAAGQWQMKVGEVWANLLGETGAVLTVNSAMLSGQKKGEVRKGLGEKNVETGAYAAYTQTAVIYVIESVPAMYSISRDAESDGAVSDANDGIMSLELANQENMVIIEVAYRISGTDQPVADSYIGQIAKYSALKTTLTLPRVLGYKAAAVRVEPQQLADVASFTPPGEDQAGTVTLNVTEEQSIKNISIYVEYEPTQVNYTVRHMHQDKVGDGYTLDVEEVLTGMTGKSVGANLQKTYEGFSYIWYDPETSIAADGSTVVEIRYNREYYLMTFDLGGGYGVEPIFARFGAEIEVDEKEIKRPGYDFVGWTDEDGNAAEIPATMPAKDTELVALWTENTSKFIVAYWLDDPNKLDAEGKPLYNYWGSYEVTQHANGTLVKTGDKVRGEDYKSYSAIADELDQYERRYSKFDHADAEVVVKGDGSTVVNVYYNRNEYTLKFYYALETKRTTDTGDKESVFSVVGGSTYNFGQYGKDVSALTNLEDNYAGKSSTGEVTAKPNLNEEGLRRNYVQGSDYSAAKGYWFHYIQFSAKYGADISEKWPCNVFNSATRQNRKLEADGSYKNNWAGVEAHVSAWNGEHRVYYSQHAPNDNQTIKGNYNQLDYKLLYCHPGNQCDKYSGGLNWVGHKEYKDSSTISYLCFWENGSDDVNWNVPKLFRYKIWVPVVEGQDISALPDNEKLEKGGVQYYLRNVYDTCDNSTAGEQTAPAIEGFEYTGVYTTDSVDDYDDTVYQSAMVINFYYTCDTYDLSFTNYGEPVKTEKVAFDQDISGKYFAPDYPAGQEKGALEFVGWYTTPAFIAGTEFEFDTMPAHDVALYAKWELMWHEARFFHTKEEMEQYQENQELPKNVYNVQHGKTLPESDEHWDSKAPNPQDPQIYPNAELYEFAGWYYLDENGVEKRFDIDSMPIIRAMDIYAKWTSNDPVKFVFKFYHENGMQLAEDYEGVALPNTPVTMSAKIGDALTMTPAGKDPLEYIPLVSSHTLVLDVDAEKNVYTFVYKEPDTINYIVQYLEAKSVTDENGREVLVPNLDKNGNLIHKATEKHVSTTKAVVTENYVPVSGYMPQETQLRLIVSMDETANVIQFLYLPNQVDAPYNVSHYIIDHDKRKSLYASEMNKLGRIDQTISVDKLNEQSIPGYTFDKAEVAVPTQVDGEWQDVLYDPDQVTETQVQHRLPNAGMHVYLYYKPIDYPVVVRYLDAVTGEPLVDANGAQIESITHMLPYGDTVKTQDYYQEIPDYRYVRMDPLEKKVEIEPNVENPTVNILNIYYTLDVADITISKTIAVSTDPDAPEPTQEQMETAFIFHVTLTHATKEQRDSYITIDGVRQPQAVKNGVLTFQLKKDQSATIHDLWGGTAYEVREEDHKDFKTSYDSFYQGELSSLDVNTVVTNTFPKYVGELTIVKQGLEADKESAIVQVKIGGDTYYLALNASNKYTAVITGIKPETDYSVEEVTDWTWQYSSGVSGGSTGNGTGRITNEHPTATVYITNRYEGDKWLHDESHVINNFDTGKSNGVNN